MSNVLKASFDTNTLEGKKRLFNAQTGASTSLKKVPDGFEMNIVDVLIYEDEVNNGYANDGLTVISVLFDEDGTSYASISDTVAKACNPLIDFLDIAGGEPVKVRLIKDKSSKGQEFLNLQLV